MSTKLKYFNQDYIWIQSTLSFYSRLRPEPYTSETVSAKFRNVKKAVKDKVASRKQTGGGPPDSFTDFEGVWYDLFGKTAMVVGIVDKDDNSQEIGLPGESLHHLMA